MHSFPFLSVQKCKNVLKCMKKHARLIVHMLTKYYSNRWILVTISEYAHFYTFTCVFVGEYMSYMIVLAVSYHVFSRIKSIFNGGS